MVPDIITLTFIFLIVNTIGALATVFLWKESRSRYQGTPQWLIGFFFQVISSMLIILRGRIPDLMSMTLANTFSIYGFILILIGLENFIEKKGRHYHNYILLTIFIVFHGYYASIHPNLNYRQFAGSFMIMLIAFQCSWTMLRKVNPEQAGVTRLTGIVFALYAAFNFIRIILNSAFPSDNNDFFHSGLINSLAILGYIVLSLCFIVSLVLMINKRLLLDVINEETKFSVAFYSSPYAITLTRKSDGVIFEVNESFSTISGYSREEVTGQTVQGLNLWASEEGRSSFLDKIQKGIEIKNIEYQFRKKSGEINTCLVSASEIIIHHETCILVSLNDISDRKKAESEIEHKNKELVSLNAEKDRFFSIIAHDLRGPLGGFISLTKVIADETSQVTPDKKKELMTRLGISASNLFKLLENLLEWSRIKQGLIPFNQENIQLLPIVQETISGISESAKRKSIEIQCNIADNFYVYADQYMLQTILRNLVSNAVKYTFNEGRIILEAEVTTNGLLEIFVTDSGIGMNNDIRRNLFQTDAQIRRKGTDGEPSTGLGLIICKDLIEIHRGKIRVESTEGSGTTFSFTLPVE